MSYKFLIDILQNKRGYLLTGLQYIEAGSDNPKLIKLVSDEINSIDKRIKDLKELDSP